MATVKVDPHNVLPHILWQSLQDTASYLAQPVEHIHWVVALSGGKDSSALAFAMANLPVTLEQVSFVHIHHGLQEQADGWRSHCESFAQSLGFAFYCEEVTVNTSARVSIEASARDARYKALRQYCKQHSKLSSGVLLIAQHEDDQLETVLLQLKRGSGPKGLSGMAKRQRIDDVLQVRPWLEQPQQTILDYISANGIAHINDPSNQNTQFDRNFLRSEILPLLTQRWPGIAKAVNRTASLCAQQNTLIEEQVSIWLSKQPIGLYSLPVLPLLELSITWQAETLRVWIRTHTRFTPSHDRLIQFLGTLNSSQDQIPELVFGDVHLRRFANQIYVVKQPENILLPEDKLSQRLSLSNQGYNIRSFSFWLVLGERQENKPTEALSVISKILCELQIPEDGHLEIAHVTTSERVLIGRDNTRSAKRLFKEKKIPPWCRCNTLVLYCNGIAMALIHAMGVTSLIRSQEINQESNLVSLVVSHRTKPDQLV